MLLLGGEHSPLAGEIVLQCIGIGYDGLAVLVEQRGEPAGIARGMKEIVHAGFPVNSDFVDSRDSFGINTDKAIVLTHRLPPVLMRTVYHNRRA